MNTSLTKLASLVREVDRRNPPTGYPVLSVSERFGIIPQTEIFTKKIAKEDLSKYKVVHYGDIVFNPYLLWNKAVGVCFLKDGGCTSPAYIVLSPLQPDREYFFHYFFRSDRLQKAVDAIASGSVTRRRTAPLHDILNLEFNLPNFADQKRINKFLSVIDNKINLNRRINRTLEEMARAIFKEWFVDNPEVGGWEVGRIGDIAKNLRRSIQPNNINPETPYIGLEHMPRKSIALTEWGHANNLASNKFIFKQGEFLFGKLRPYFHKVGVAPLDGVCSTDILVITPKATEWSGVVLGYISSTELVDFVNSGSTGTKMPRTSWEDLARFEIALPPIENAKKYNEIVDSILNIIRINIMESRTLANLRDTLLPKLMSGEVRVDGFDVTEVAKK